MHNITLSSNYDLTTLYNTKPLFFPGMLMVMIILQILDNRKKYLNSHYYIFVNLVNNFFFAISQFMEDETFLKILLIKV